VRERRRSTQKGIGECGMSGDVFGEFIWVGREGVRSVGGSSCGVGPSSPCWDSTAGMERHSLVGAEVCTTVVVFSCGRYRHARGGGSGFVVTEQEQGGRGGEDDTGRERGRG